MKIFAPLVLILFMCLPSFAKNQKSKADSVLRLVNKHPQKDTIRVNLLNNYLKLKLYENPDSTFLTNAEEALAIAEQMQFQKGIALSFQKIGLAHHYLLNQPKKAIEFYYKSMDASSMIADKRYDKYKRNFAVSNYTMIAILYTDMGDYKKAIEINNKLLGLLKSEKTTPLGNVYNNLGLCYTRIENFEKGAIYFKLAIALGKELKDIFLEATGFSNLSNSLSKLGKIQEATIAVERSLSLAETYNIELLKSSVYSNAAFIYRIKKEFRKAEEYSKKAIAISKQLNYIISERDAMLTLFEVYEDQHKYKEALSTYTAYTLLKDSINNTEKRTEINKKDIQFEADKKQAIANEEIKNQKLLRNYSVAGIAILLIAAIGTFIFYKKHRDSIQKQNELLYKAKVADTDMRILRLQMNPHFIFNSLNSISDYISKNDIQNADYYLSKFAKLMRAILENSEEKEITLADELKMLELYMQLEGSRLNNKFTYEIKVSEDVDAEITMIPPLILQPFVENSIWHGLADKDGVGKITIEVTHDNTMLNCVVEDNGVGRQAAKPSSGKSYGMKITKDRIELLNKLKNTNASVNLIDLEKGTRVEVKLPFETEA